MLDYKTKSKPRLFITGDTHGHLDIEKIFDPVFIRKLGRSNKDNVLLILGDFGLCFFNNTDTCVNHFDEHALGRRKEEQLLDKLEQLPVTVLFIDGNHENFDRLYQYPEMQAYGGKVGVLRPHVLHLKQRGHIYSICGYNCFCFGGAFSHDKQLRVQGESWWPQEEPSDAEYNYGASQLHKAIKDGIKIDYIFTHDAPSIIASWMIAKNNGWSFEMINNKLTMYLQLIASKINFTKWYFAHYHKDCNLVAWGDDFGNRTKDDPLFFSCCYELVTELPDYIPNCNVASDNEIDNHVINNNYISIYL